MLLSASVRIHYCCLILSENYENRLTGVSGGGVNASFVYAPRGHPDGNRVKGTVGGVTTVYIGGLYEHSGSVHKKYYEGPGGIAAVRDGSSLSYLLQDHLNSTARIVTSSGTIQDTTYYFPFGGKRAGNYNSITAKRYTGQYYEKSLASGNSEDGLYYYGARWYDGKLGRFISADPLVPEPRNPQDWNRYSYVRNNPLKYIDPSGHTARSALDLVRYLRNEIVTIAQEFDLDPLLLAGVVFSENRNDYNWLREKDWTAIFTLHTFGAVEIKNFLAPHLDSNPSLGITEVSLGVAAMMDDPSLVPSNYGEMSFDERRLLQDQIAKGLPKNERQRILNSLSDPVISLQYSAKYLKFLQSYRDYGDNYALWLTEYNRGLSEWDTVLPYGRRFEKYRNNIEHSLYWKEPSPLVCPQQIGCGVWFDQMLYGQLPH
ncbi:MAG: hypothetical protein KF893_18340 [Caldilineaceae bacterium]|nr:hypothetical protein [Caldilineaceae bacterium]